MLLPIVVNSVHIYSSLAIASAYVALNSNEDPLIEDAISDVALIPLVNCPRINSSVLERCLREADCREHPQTLVARC